MIDILTVCTGNICRSPLAAAVLQTRLMDLGARVSSSGTRARDGSPVTAQTEELARRCGADPRIVTSHRARLLQESHIHGADLILAMTRDQRREIVETTPAKVRTVFTAREFARLSAEIEDSEIFRVTLGVQGTSFRERFPAVLALVASRRGVSYTPASSADDDVVDPYGRSMATYERAASQLAPALDAVERIVRLVRP